MGLIRYAQFCFLQLYLLSVFIYTLYGVFKSTNEYFCTQKRPDSPDFAANFEGLFINLTNGFRGKDGLDYLLLSSKESLILYTRLSNNVGDVNVNDPNNSYKSYTKHWFPSFKEVGDTVKLNYEIDASYFDVVCDNIDTQSGYHFPQKEGVFDLPQSEGPNIIKIDSNGYFIESTTKSALKVNELKHLELKKVSCKILKSPQTCSLSLETTNLFFLLYLAIISINLLMFVLMMTKFKSYLTLRVYIKITNFFNGVKKPEFCNPHTNSAVFNGKGTFVYKITTRADTEKLTLPIKEVLTTYKDKEGEYYLNCRGLVLIKKENCCVTYNVDEYEENLLGVYFFNTTMSPEKCCVDNDYKHYLKTSEVIKHVCGGGGLKLTEVPMGVFTLDVKEFELDYITKMYNLKKDIVKRLLEHNWQFFKNGYDLKALENCLRRKTWSRDSPSSVKNTQWKYYTSDFKKIMESFGYNNYKCQSIYKGTAALDKALNCPIEELIVHKMEGEVLVKAKPKPVNNEKVKHLLEIYNSGFMQNKQEERFLSDEIPKYKEGLDAFEGFKAINADLEPVKEKKHGQNDDDIEKKIINNLEKKLAENVKIINTYKDVLLNPPTVVSKEGSKLRTKILKQIRNMEKSGKSDSDPEVTKLKTEVEVIEKTSRVKSPMHDRLILAFGRRDYIKDALMPAVKIITYENIKKLLDEDERKNDDGQPHSNPKAHFEIVKIDKAKVYNEVKSSKQLYKTCKKKRRNKKQRDGPSIDKGAAKLKQGFLSNDFELHFEAALNSVLREHDTDIPEMNHKSVKRCRTFYLIKNALKQKLKQKLMVENKTDGMKPKSKMTPSNSQSLFIKNMINLFNDKDLMHGVEEMTGIYGFFQMFD